VAAAVPFGLGMMWTLGEPEFESLRVRLPRGCCRLVEGLRTH
jgi:hypothetical protein